MTGTLYVIPTPIGNKQDLTLRAIEVLGSIDVIAAEDTRHTGQLLAQFNLKKPFISYHEHNEQLRIPQLINLLTEGQKVGLVSDAGMPSISDPGYKLIHSAIEAGIIVEVLPGASAILVALAGSGLPTDRFYFGGFLPRTPGKRQQAFTEIASLPATLIFYESPHRIAATLQDAYTSLGDRKVVIARELTKLHEEYVRTTLSEAVEKYKKAKVKGEIVLLIDRPIKNSRSKESY